MHGNPRLGVLTALPKEHAAVKRMLSAARSLSIEGDPTIYTLGTVPGPSGQHRILLACQSKYANNPAAVTVTNIARSFPTIEAIIFVGIAAGVPRPKTPKAHVRLGDVIVSSGPGVIQFDLGAVTKEGFEPRSSHPPPSANLLQAVNLLESFMLTGEFSWAKHLQQVLTAAEVVRPDREPLKPFHHPKDPLREKGIPRVFYGRIGASNTLLKYTERRDDVANRFGLLAIEMEGSGVADATWEAGLGYLLIRSACDYGSEEKDDSWQVYASHVAAAYLGALLLHLPTSPAESTSIASRIVESEAGKADRLTSTGDDDPLQHVTTYSVSDARLTCCTFMSDEKHAMCGGFEGSIFEVDLTGGSSPRHTTTEPSIVRCLHHLHNHRNSYLVGNDAGSILLASPDINQTHRIISLGSPVYWIAAGYRDDTILLADRTGAVSEWVLQISESEPSASQGRRLRVIDRHSSVAFCALFDTIERRYVSVGADGCLRETSLATGRQESTLITKATLFCLDLGHHRPLILLGDSQGKLHKLSDSEGAVCLEGHTDAIRSVHLSPNNNWAVTGSKDGTVRVWHMTSMQTHVVFQSPDYIYQVLLSRSGRLILAVDGAGSLITIELPDAIDSLTPERLAAI